jgi:hypothetical protein
MPTDPWFQDSKQEANRLDSDEGVLVVCVLPEGGDCPVGCPI